MKKFISASAMGAMLMLAAALPAIAETATSTPATNQLDFACIQNAVDKRELGVALAVENYTTPWKSALLTRQIGLKNAWQVTDKKERRAALAAVWKEYRATLASIRVDYKSAIRTAWRTYYTDRKACGDGSLSDDRMMEGVDSL